jgi:hypothetical protein
MRSIVSLVALALLAGCAGDNGAGSASIYVKDAVTDDFDEVHVVFTEVRVHAAGNDSWMLVWQNQTGADVDLLAASGDLAVFLGEAELAAGRYTQVRINATEAYGIKDNETIPITLTNPSLKVVRSFEIEDGEETRIVLDFDLEQSLHQQGQGGWRMTPVIGKTFVEVVEDGSSGEDVSEEGDVVEVEGSGDA